MTIHDVGESDTAHGTVPFLVMELVEGEPLAAIISRGRLNADRTLDLLEQAGNALNLWAEFHTQRTLLFRAGDRTYGCGIDAVREIVPQRRATRLPGAPEPGSKPRQVRR